MSKYRNEFLFFLFSEIISTSLIVNSILLFPPCEGTSWVHPKLLDGLLKLKNLRVFQVILYAYLYGCGVHGGLGLGSKG